MCKCSPQPELHLPQCWGSPHLRSQWGADHWATSPAPAPNAAPTATSAPAQPHIPGLLRLSTCHGGGELSGGGEDGWTGPCNPPAPRHGVLPKLPSPLPGKVFQISLYILGPSLIITHTCIMLSILEKIRRTISATISVQLKHSLFHLRQVSNWSVKQPTNKRTSKSSLHRPLDLDTPTSEESSASFDQLSVPSFKVFD